MPNKELRQQINMRITPKLLARVDKRVKLYKTIADNRSELTEILWTKWCNGEIKLSVKDKKARWG